MQPFLKVVLTVLLAHLVGDFPLQTSKLMRGKERGSRAYVVHGGIHFLILLMCVAVFAGHRMLADVWFWTLAALYISLHLAIDRAKQGLVSTGRFADSATMFVVDQVLHLSTILLFAWFVTRPGWSGLRAQFSWAPATGEKVLETGVVYIAVVFAGGYLIRYLTRDLTARVETHGGTTEEVRNAGMYIGWLERFLVVTAILVQSPSMVGLILTGKSIARFPELKAKFAEYFLIGTLLSLALAVVGGLVLVKLWYGTISLK